MPKMDGVRRGTGHGREEWFDMLDAWGAAGRPYREIADWLTDEQGLTKWWAQKLIVEYQQARGLRAPGVRRDGTFEVSTSKTIAVPVERAFEAFVNSRERKKWLADSKMSLRTSAADRSARFTWQDGTTRVSVGFVDKGPSKTTVAVAHDRLPDADRAQVTKAMWKDRLAELKVYLEA